MFFIKLNKKNQLSLPFFSESTGRTGLGKSIIKNLSLYSFIGGFHHT